MVKLDSPQQEDVKAIPRASGQSAEMIVTSLNCIKNTVAHCSNARHIQSCTDNTLWPHDILISCTTARKLSSCHIHIILITSAFTFTSFTFTSALATFPPRESRPRADDSCRRRISALSSVTCMSEKGCRRTKVLPVSAASPACRNQARYKPGHPGIMSLCASKYKVEVFRKRKTCCLTVAGPMVSSISAPYMALVIQSVRNLNMVQLTPCSECMLDGVILPKWRICSQQSLWKPVLMHGKRLQNLFA